MVRNLQAVVLNFLHKPSSRYMVRSLQPVLVRLREPSFGTCSAVYSP